MGSPSTPFQRIPPKASPSQKESKFPDISYDIPFEPHQKDPPPSSVKPRPGGTRVPSHPLLEAGLHAAPFRRQRGVARAKALVPGTRRNETKRPTKRNAPRGWGPNRWRKRKKTVGPKFDIRFGCTETVGEIGCYFLDASNRWRNCGSHFSHFLDAPKQLAKKGWSHF